MLTKLPAEAILSTLQEGMGTTLGFVATVVGLGTLLGGLLEHSGGAEVLAHRLLSAFGEKRSSWALLCTGLFWLSLYFLMWHSSC